MTKQGVTPLNGTHPSDRQAAEQKAERCVFIICILSVAPCCEFSVSSWLMVDRQTNPSSGSGSGHHDHCTALTITSAWNGTDFYLLLSLFSICVLSNQSLRSVLSSRVNPSRVSSPARRRFCHGCSGHTRCTRVYHVRYSARTVKPFHQNEMTRTDNIVWHIFWSDKMPRGAGQAWVDGCTHGFHTEVRSLIRASLVTPSTQKAGFFAWIWPNVCDCFSLSWTVWLCCLNFTKVM